MWEKWLTILDPIISPRLHQLFVIFFGDFVVHVLLRFDLVLIFAAFQLLQPFQRSKTAIFVDFLALRT